MALSAAITAAIDAGRAIMEVYAAGFDVEMKEDNSPLTEADRKSHYIIEAVLKKSGLPVLSEEGREIDFGARKKWNAYWLVDPLDGTKEFIRRNGEFTVNIALMDREKPIFGIIYVPVSGDLYFGGKAYGAHLLKNLSSGLPAYEAYLSSSVKLPVVNGRKTYTMIGSRSHMSPETQKYFEDVRLKRGNVEILSKGSSLKLCMIAEGRADEYPRFAPTMEWDIAAGHAIIEGAGGWLRHYKSGETMRYNKENLINGWFVAGLH